MMLIVTVIASVEQKSAAKRECFHASGRKPETVYLSVATSHRKVFVCLNVPFRGFPAHPTLDMSMESLDRKAMSPKTEVAMHFARSS